VHEQQNDVRLSLTPIWFRLNSILVACERQNGVRKGRG
jgi:hypothetical protein